MKGLQLRIALKQMLMPPAIVIWLLVIGLLFQPVGGIVPWLAVLILYGLSINPVANMLLQKLESYYPPLNMTGQYSEAQAIVVLGGGLPRNSPELNGFQPTALTLERARYAALLQKRTGLPVLVAGGGPRADADAMANYLTRDYGINALFIENRSLTTRQNAIFSKKLLSEEELNKILLVTHAWHMPRSVLSFKQAGFDVIPAPTAYSGSEVSWGMLTHWIPRAKNMRLCELALNEYMGLVWYRFRKSRYYFHSSKETQ